MTSNSYSELEKIKTPIIENLVGFEEADDELLPIAKYIVKNSSHHDSVDVGRIKYLYCDKIKKDGGRFIAGDLIKRPDHEIILNNDYDFFLMVYYPVWKDLTIEHKVVQLDKLLCGVDVEADKVAKKAKDCREYTACMVHFGLNKVVESSEIVHLACQRLEEEKKEKAKEKKPKKSKKNND